MAYLDPSSAPQDQTHGADHPRHRARHGDPAPEPYVASETYVASEPHVASEPAWPGPGPQATGVGDQTLVFDQPLRTTRTRAGRAERRRQEAADGNAAANVDAGGSGRRSGRAGRNLPAAIGVGVGLGALVLGSLFVWPPSFLGVIVAAMAVAIWEMTRAVRPGGARPPLVPLLAGGVVMVVLAWFGGPGTLALGLFGTVLAALVWRLADGPEGFQRDLTASVLIIMYVPLLGGFASMLAAAPDDGNLRIVVTLAGVVLSDTGGYAAGVFLGRHPMAPTVSPKKSWEGFGGSLLAAAVGSAVLLYLLLEVAPWWGAVFGIAVAVAAVLGDLVESMLKRDLGIKDMSDLLPGHGGLMDRLDSILFALPVAYVLLSLMAPAG